MWLSFSSSDPSCLRLVAGDIVASVVALETMVKNAQNVEALA